MITKVRFPSEKWAKAVREAHLKKLDKAEEEKRGEKGEGRDGGKEIDRG